MDIEKNLTAIGPDDKATKLEANDEKWNRSPDPWNRPFPKRPDERFGNYPKFGEGRK